jgi:hypothetical protein
MENFNEKSKTIVKIFQVLQDIKDFKEIQIEFISLILDQIENLMI